MNYSDIDGDESHFSSPPPGSGIVTASDGTILHADPLPPESQSTGKHSQVFPEYSIIDHPGGKKAHIKFSPLQDINVGKIQYTASTKDRRVGLVSWPKGGSADPKAVRRALTSGHHVISYPQDGTLHGESLQLDQADAVVAAFTEDARSRHVSDGEMARTPKINWLRSSHPLKQLQYCCNMISRLGQDFSKYRIK